jgi:hypothetical protein
LLRIDHGGRHGTRGEHAHSAQADEALCARIVVCLLCDLAVAVGEERVEFAQMLELSRDLAALFG